MPDCRLCWRITAAVFGLILLVESLLLIPSAMRFERTELQRLGEVAVTAIESMLALVETTPSADTLQRGLDNLVGKMGVNGLLALRTDGAVLATAGERLESNPRVGEIAAGGEVSALARSADGGRYEVAWRQPGGGEDLVFLARLDSTHVSEGLVAYMLRIGGLVGVIVLVVTAGTMLVLHFALLSPVLRLRQSMRRAALHPDRANEFALRTRRSDELGEVIAAHNDMLAKVADSIRRDREIAEERARFLSHHDPLTGMPNRTAFLEHVHCRRTAEGEPPCGVTVCLIDMVEFRRINTAFGQQLGDRLLQEMGRRAQRAAGAGDFVARLEADRFAVARYGARTTAEAAAMAEKLLRDVSGSYVLEGTDISVALRIGVAHVPKAGASGEELLNQAELALERTDAEAGNRYEFFAPAMAEQAKQRQVVARELEAGLHAGELFLVYQPKFELGERGGDRLSGAEALVRWRHPTRGLVGPNLFIPIAEATGLIAPIGEYVLRAACGQVKLWLERHNSSPRIAVNLSAHQFSDPVLVALVARVIEEAGVPAQLLELEVTESAAMRDVEKTAATLHELRRLGVHVSIDDFGTGYSSLSYLRRFAIDAIKIDKSFIDEIGDDANAEAICQAIIDMGRALGKRVIAEGVETERQRLFLLDRGCHEVQGYLFGRPEPAEDFQRRHLFAPAAN